MKMKRCGRLTSNEFDQIVSDNKKGIVHKWSSSACAKSELWVRFNPDDLVNTDRLINNTASSDTSLDMTNIDIILQSLYNKFIEQSKTIQALIEEVKDLKRYNQEKIIKLEEEVSLLHRELHDVKEKVSSSVVPSEIINEINEREINTKNIIVYNVPERRTED